MRTPLLAAALLLAVAAPSGAASRCTPLLSDPAGDVQETGHNPPPPVEDVSQVDLLSVDLSSSRSSVTARFRLASLNPESQPLEAHAYEVGFTSAGQRYYLVATHDATADRYTLHHLTSGSAPPEDQPVPAATSESLGEVTGSYVTRQHVVTITARLAQFDGGGGLGKELTSIRASTYAGTRAPGGEIFEWADHGRTDRVHRIGTGGCAP
jgi:hypothetical protein